MGGAEKADEKSDKFEFYIEGDDSLSEDDGFMVDLGED